MNKEMGMIDQSELAESVSNSIKTKFFDFFLVKPLDPIKVTKEFSKPVSTGTPKTDENGVEAQDFENVETEVKEVDSDYRKGIVLKLPMFYETATEEEAKKLWPIKVGSVVVFRDRSGASYDLLKDSKLLRQYEILGIEQ